MKGGLTEIQHALLDRLAVGDKIVCRYGHRSGFWFEAFSPAGAELDGIDHGLPGKRTLTMSTLKGLTKKGYLDYDDNGFGKWTRTPKVRP